MTVCDRGEGGSKIIKNSVTYFMDSAYISVPQCLHFKNNFMYKFLSLFTLLPQTIEVFTSIT